MTLSGQCKHDKDDPRPYMQTLTGAKLPSIFQSVSRGALYVTSTQVILLNDDRCSIGQHVIVRRHLGDGLNPYFIACVREIIQQVGSPNYEDARKPNGILLETFEHVNNPGDRLPMPRLVPCEEWSFVPLNVSL